jgi:hypothetical protein
LGALVVSYEDKIKDQAQPYLLEGERVLAAFIARPKGAAMQNAVGGVVGNLVGGRKAVRQTRVAREAGLRLADPMALVLTSSRLLVLKISFPLAMGKGADVKELASEAPLSDVDSIEVKRLFAGKTVTVTVRGAAFMLEAGVGADPQGLAREFDGIRAGSAAD